MVHKKIGLLVFYWLVFPEVASPQSRKPNYADFRVGAPAPELVVERWLKGEPVGSFEQGKLYLVEFTHTSCLPCRLAIPFLEKLAIKHSDRLHVVSVYTYYKTDKTGENEYMKSILGILKGTANYRNISVAVSRRDLSRLREWIGSNLSPPCAYLVDGDKLLWWGRGLDHFYQLDEVIGKIRTGTYEAGKYLSERKQVDDALERLSSLSASGMNEAALRGMDSLISANRSLATKLHYYKFKLLLDMPDGGRAAGEFLRSVLDADSGFSAGLYEFVNDRARNLDHRLGIEIVNRLIRKSADAASTATLCFYKAEIYHNNLLYGEALRACDEGLQSLASEPDTWREMMAYYSGKRSLYHYLSLASEAPDMANDWLDEALCQGTVTAAAGRLIRAQGKEFLDNGSFMRLERYIEESERNEARNRRSNR